MMTTRVSDYLRYYLVFSPTEQTLSSEEFTALLDSRLAEARLFVLTQRALPVCTESVNA